MLSYKQAVRMVRVQQKRETRATFEYWGHSGDLRLQGAMLEARRELNRRLKLELEAYRREHPPRIWGVPLSFWYVDDGYVA